VEDGSGGAFVTWRDERTGYNLIDVYVQHVLGDGIVDPLWPANGRAICTLPGSQSEAQVATDDSGGVYVAWSDTREPPKQLVFVQHVFGDGTIDPAWPTDGLAVSPLGTAQLMWSLVKDGGGGVHVIWQDEGRIRVQHVLKAGLVDPSWPPGGVAACVTEAIQTQAVGVSDESGGVLAIWRDERAGSDVYAQHVLGTGVIDPAWSVYGEPVATLPWEEWTPWAVGDGTGAAIVVWQDWKTNEYGLSAARVTPTPVVGVWGGPPGAVGIRVTPNPARHEASLQWTVPREGRGSLMVFDINGRRVRLLMRGHSPAGTNAVRWDLRDDAGRRIPPGLYLARLSVDGVQAVARVLVCG
jgi:hypothetical protein